jgi:hypothetical protein
MDAPCPPFDACETDTAPVSFTILRVRAIETKHVYALIDVELSIAGICFTIAGIQARHLAQGGTSINLPKYRDADGTWRSAVDVPPELRDAVSSAILDHLLDIGVAKRASDSTAPAA